MFRPLLRGLPPLLIILLAACGTPEPTPASPDPALGVQRKYCPPDAEPDCEPPPPTPVNYDLPQPVDLSIDNDGDGLTDGLEDALAAYFMPSVWFDPGENYGCSGPAAPWHNGTVLARVRPHPADPGKVAVTYLVLYNRDCGDFLSSGHDGDVEPFSLTLAPNAACPNGYGAYAARTTAHAGTIGESVETAQLGLSCSWGRAGGGSGELFSAENKHGNYLTLARCDRGGVLGSDHCGRHFRVNYDVLNVGEFTRRRLNALAAHQFPGEFAWSGTSFCGGRGACSGKAGTVLGKLLDDSLLAAAD